ncbi:MAG: ABC transporter substrate-binding protein, partial [Clostridia bacterium]|nr:ABC transporter substrate-binding protein [Clostridia bacterium]
MMKKALSTLLILVLLFAATAICEETIRIGALKGPTAMGMVGMMRDCPDYTFTLEGSADALTPALIKGDLDIAAVPANLASILYN